MQIWFRTKLYFFFSNLTIDEIYQITKTNIISNYCFTGTRVDIGGSEFNSFQVSNTAIEKQLLQNGDDSFAIELNECENILKDNYNISDNASLIILKFLKQNNGNKQIYN